jgi:hypothetical protein
MTCGAGAGIGAGGAITSTLPVGALVGSGSGGGSVDAPQEPGLYAFADSDRAASSARRRVIQGQRTPKPYDAATARSANEPLGLSSGRGVKRVDDGVQQREQHALD